MPGAEQYITQVVILNLCKHADKLVQQLVGADGLVPGGGVTSPSNCVREGLDLPGDEQPPLSGPGHCPVLDVWRAPLVRVW